MKSFLRRTTFLSLLILACSGLATKTQTAWAQAQTYIVNTTNDTVDDTDNVLSLREAIAAANANTSDGDAIQFDAMLSGQTITLIAG